MASIRYYSTASQRASHPALDAEMKVALKEKRSIDSALRYLANAPDDESKSTQTDFLLQKLERAKINIKDVQDRFRIAVQGAGCTEALMHLHDTGDLWTSGAEVGSKARTIICRPDFALYS